MLKLTSFAKQTFAVAVILGFALSVTASAALAADVTWNVAGVGVWDMATPNWTGDSTTYTDGDNVAFDNAIEGDPATEITVVGRSPTSTVSDSTGDFRFVTNIYDPVNGATKAGGPLMSASFFALGRRSRPA